MKVAITGHTKGFGKSLYNLLSTEYECFGFSRSNGFDLHDPNTLQSILDINPDVFINNAAVNQTLLLQKTYDAWKLTEKSIVNIGSYITELSTVPEHRKVYYENKIQLARLSKLISNRKETLRCMLFVPGTINTKSALEAKSYILNQNMESWMDPDYLAKVVRFMILSPYTITDLKICQN